jgi:hypothetical protein
LKSVACSDPSLTFDEVTAPDRSCVVPTLFFGSVAAA